RQPVGDVTKTRKLGIISLRVEPTPVPERKTFRRLGVLESAISNQLRIQSAIDAKINLLQKNAIHSRIHSWPRFTEIDVDSRSAPVSGCREQDNHQGSDSSPKFAVISFQFAVFNSRRFGSIFGTCILPL